MTDFSKERRYINGSLLPAASTPVSAGELISWVAELAEKIRAAVDMSSAQMQVWAYRHYGQHLSVDILDAGGKYYTLTFKMAPGISFDDDEPEVPDMAEALHIAGLLNGHLKLPVTIGLEPRDVSPNDT